MGGFVEREEKHSTESFANNECYLSFYFAARACAGCDGKIEGRGKGNLNIDHWFARMGEEILYSVVYVD
jgi:hypothetical protein